MASAVSVSGDKAAAAQLEATGKRATSQRQVLADVARKTAKAITGIPVDTGRLEDSIAPLWVNDSGFAVGTRVPYSRYVFNGTRYMAAQPPSIPPDIDVVAARAMANDIVG